MDQIRVIGEKNLHGEVVVSGAKNAALPILFSALLTEGKCLFDRVPELQDIQSTLKLLELMGVAIRFDSHRAELTAQSISNFEAPYDLVRKMRASVLVMGPLLARFGRARVSLPGGCAIGARPINFHLEAFKKLGASIELEGGYVEAHAAQGLKGGKVRFDYPSVGATENIMMACSLAEGESVLENCAREPEIVDLARVLIKMGSVIEGAGSSTIHVQGKKTLKGCTHEIIGDRIEAGTFLCAALATQGFVKVHKIDPQMIEAILIKIKETGAIVNQGSDWVSVEMRKRPKAIDFETAPFPGFPTDMQAQFMAFLSVASGVSQVTETVFENRFMHVPELIRLGADIKIVGNRATVQGRDSLKGAPIMATDLRASASLLIAAMAARGETVLNRVYHLDRGYERIEEKLRALGAEIERVKI